MRSETADMFALAGEDDDVFQDVNLNAATYSGGQVGDESMQGLVFEGDSGFGEGGLEFDEYVPAPHSLSRYDPTH